MFFTPKVPQITPEELRDRYEKGTAPTIVDVREPHEVSGFDLDPKAIHIRMNELDRGMKEIPQDGSDVVVCCSGGVRSARAIKQWSDAGLKNLLNLSGGTDAWRRMPPK